MAEFPEFPPRAGIAATGRYHSHARINIFLCNYKKNSETFSSFGVLYISVTFASILYALFVTEIRALVRAMGIRFIYVSPIRLNFRRKGNFAGFVFLRGVSPIIIAELR